MENIFFFFAIRMAMFRVHQAFLPLQVWHLSHPSVLILPAYLLLLDQAHQDPSSQQLIFLTRILESVSSGWMCGTVLVYHWVEYRHITPNKNRRKAIFNWAAKGLFFLKGGGGYTHSGYHKILSATIACDRTSCETDPFDQKKEYHF